MDFQGFQWASEEVLVTFRGVTRRSKASEGLSRGLGRWLNFRMFQRVLRGFWKLERCFGYLRGLLRVSRLFKRYRRASREFPVVSFEGRWFQRASLELSRTWPVFEVSEYCCEVGWTWASLLDTLEWGLYSFLFLSAWTRLIYPLTAPPLPSTLLKPWVPKMLLMLTPFR